MKFLKSIFQKKIQSQTRRKLQKLLPPLFQKEEIPLFHHVQFETVSICNNDCSFCPMNIHLKKREYKEADWVVIERLGNELQNYSFEGILSLFNNNEPLIDRRLPDIVAFFRKKAPRANIRIMTNGILINIKVVEQLIKAGISYIHINNYNEKNEFIPSVSKFINDFSISKFKDSINVVVTMRYKNEVLHNRGGNSPNIPVLAKSKKWFCIFPFEQININPWGDMTICCNDVLYKRKMGNIMGDKSIYQLWASKEYKNIRNLLSNGKREGIDICSVCNNPGIERTIDSRTGKPIGHNITYKVEKSVSGIEQLRWNTEIIVNDINKSALSG